MHARELPAPVVTTPSGDRLHACRCDVVGVAEARGEYRLVTTTRIASGVRLFQLEGEIVRVPTRYSVQIGRDMHLDAGSEHGLQEVFERFFFRFMNHHCEPATMILGRDVIALRDMAAWELSLIHI